MTLPAGVRRYALALLVRPATPPDRREAVGQRGADSQRAHRDAGYDTGRLPPRIRRPPIWRHRRWIASRTRAPSSSRRRPACRSRCPRTAPFLQDSLRRIIGSRQCGSGARSSQTTLAEVLRARGMRTGAFVGSIVVGQNRGLAQGFETYSAPSPVVLRERNRRPGRLVVDDALPGCNGRRTARSLPGFTVQALTHRTRCPSRITRCTGTPPISGPWRCSTRR